MSKSQIGKLYPDIKKYIPSNMGKMLMIEDGKYVRIVDYHRLSLELKKLDAENDELHREIMKIEEDYGEMKTDYNKRRSQAKRYQRSAGRRNKVVEQLTARVEALEGRE